MKVSPVVTRVNPRVKSNVSFERKLKEEEKPQYTHAINDALDYLGVKNLSMIIHGSSFPSDKRDTSIGSPYSKGSEKFVDFLKLNGFNSVQLGPGGTIGKEDVSPYISKVYAKNELFIDLEQLKSEKYAGILSEQTYNKLTTENKETKDKNYNYANFNKAFSVYDEAMKEAFLNFEYMVDAKNPNALKLNEEYNKFKEDNKNWVEYDGLYKVLSEHYGTGNYEEWKVEEDRNLPVHLKSGDKKAQIRYKQLMRKYGKDVERNTFTQFIADKQLRENNKHRKEIGFNYIGDLLVGFSESDVWANQNAFLKGWKLGCPYGGAGNGPQTWGIPVLDPKKLFTENGALGVSGRVLKEKIEYSLKNYDNVRIDHALGLVDPYIYNEKTVHKDSNGAVNRDKLWANNVSNLHEIDPHGNFKQVLSKIVLPTFKEYGVDKNEAVWEDLGSTTQTFERIYRQQENLPGITQTLWSRAENAPRKDNWSLVVSHDFEPASEMVQKDWVRNSDAWNVDYLSGYLNPDPAKAEAKEKYKEDIINSKQERVNAKFTELFRGTQNLQIMFSDFFGINKTYNIGGQDNDNNWKLRVDNDFENDYYRSLQDKNSYALNMPQILAQAVRAKSGMDVAKVSADVYKANALRTELDSKLSPLLQSLDNYAEILKEEENINETVVNKENENSVKKTTIESENVKTKPIQNSENTDKKENLAVHEVKADSEKKVSSKSSGKTATVLGLAVLATGVFKLVDKIKSKIQKRRQEKQLIA